MSSVGKSSILINDEHHATTRPWNPKLKSLSLLLWEIPPDAKEMEGKGMCWVRGMESFREERDARLGF